MTDGPFPIMFGVETEYAVAAALPNGRPARDIGASLIRIARRAYPNLADAARNDGMFLANGARLYLDRGDHPEYATPECRTPVDLLIQIRRGEAIMLDLAQRLTEESGVPVSVYRTNVDYDGQATWGQHESFLIRVPPSTMAEVLLPHLATRILYTGGGGFFRPNGGGWRFTLSPRGHRLDRVSSSETTHSRGLFHVKDEPLAGGEWRRLHLICGDGLCGDVPLVLRAGTTALILACLELGSRPPTSVKLTSPLEALRRYAADPSCRERAGGGGGRGPTALDVQVGYLEMVEQRLGSGILPDWAHSVCRLWRDQLEVVARNPADAASMLDWPLKEALFQRWISPPDLWPKLPALSRLLSQLQEAMNPTEEIAKPVIQIEAVLRSEQFPSELERVTPLLTAQGATWDELRAVARLGPRLNELEFRFGQLGPAGIHSQLVGQGLIRRLVGDDGAQLPGAPPPGTRAVVRGAIVEQLAAEADRRRYACDWSGVHDTAARRRFRFPDPFATAGEWQDLPDAGPPPGSSSELRSEIRRAVLELF